jgi:hypothetical protein
MAYSVTRHTDCTRETVCHEARVNVLPLMPIIPIRLSTAPSFTKTHHCFPPLHGYLPHTILSKSGRGWGLGVLKIKAEISFIPIINPLTPELNPSAQRCLTSYFPTSLLTWWSELLTTNHEVTGSIPGCAMRILPCRVRSP